MTEDAGVQRFGPVGFRGSPLALLVDPDDPRFLNPPGHGGGPAGFCRETRQPVPETPGALVRCILESLALKYETVLRQLETLTGNRIRVVHIVGGGSRNELLNQWTADATARPVVAGPVEATEFGNVLVQSRALGELGSLAEMRRAVVESSELRTFGPRPTEWIDGPRRGNAQRPPDADAFVSALMLVMDDWRARVRTLRTSTQAALVSRGSEGGAPGPLAGLSSTRFQLLRLEWAFPRKNCGLRAGC